MTPVPIFGEEPDYSCEAEVKYRTNNPPSGTPAVGTITWSNGGAPATLGVGWEAIAVIAYMGLIVVFWIFRGDNSNPAFDNTPQQCTATPQKMDG